MCLLIILYRTSAEAPIMIGANREEHFSRPFDPPAVDPGPPKVVCGRDRLAGGTWLGINEHGVLVAVTNRPPVHVPPNARSRGTLCRELLNCSTAADATHQAREALATGQYAPANFVCIDRRSAAIISTGKPPHVVDLAPGLHFLTNGQPDDPADMRQSYARELLMPRFPRTPADFCHAAAAVLATGPNKSGERTIIVRSEDRGTVCSTIATIAAQPEKSTLQFAAGPPDQRPYEDLSHLLHQVLQPVNR